MDCDHFLKGFNEMRKSKLLPKVIKKLIEAIENGNYVNISCAYAGICEATYYNWIERAEREIERYNNDLEFDTAAKIKPAEKKYVEFLESVYQAQVKAEVEAVTEIRKSFKDDWRAGMAYLERRYPERWGRKVIGFSSDDGTKDFSRAFANALSDIDDEDLDAKTSIKH